MRIPARYLLLPVLAALVTWAGSARASGLIIDERQNPSATDQQNLQHLRTAVISKLRERNAPITEVSWQAVTTAGAGAGQLTTSAGVEQHDWVCKLGFTLTVTPANASVYDNRVSLNGVTWPSKPHLYVIYPAGGSGTASNSGGDSTGTSDSYPYPAVMQWGSLYFTRDPSLRWKNMYGAVKPAISSSSARSYITGSSSGIWRPLIGWSTTPASNGALATGAANAVVDPDSLRNGGVQYPDTVVLWQVERFPGDPAAQVFCYAGATGIVDLSTIDAALAAIDSITARTIPGGAVFTDRRRTTKRRAIAVRGVTQTARPHQSIELVQGGGVNCPDASPADSCDRGNFGTGAAMVDALGVPWTAYVDPESLATAHGAANLAQLAGLRNVRYGMAAVSGTFAGSTTRAAGAGRCVDPVGVVRERAVPVGTYPPGCATAADSAQIFCNMANGWATHEARFPGKVDYSFLPGLYDWSPKQWTRAGNGGLKREEVLAALWCGGKTRAILFNPVSTNSNVALSYATSGSVSTYATSPAGWELGERTLPISWNGKRLGSMALLGVRDEPFSPMWRWKQESHPGLNQEYLAGADLGKYYLIDASPYYHHTFATTTSVFVVPAISLGGPYAGPWPQRPGVHMINSLVRGSRVANALAPPWANGDPKILNEWVYVSDLTPRTGGFLQ